MIREEWGLSPVDVKPLHAALITLFAFITVGIGPLLPYILFSFEDAASGFAASCVATMFAFAAIGVGRAQMTQRSVWRCTMETFLAGVVAACAAYGIGYGLKQWLT